MKIITRLMLTKKNFTFMTVKLGTSHRDFMVSLEILTAFGIYLEETMINTLFSKLLMPISHSLIWVYLAILDLVPLKHSKMIQETGVFSIK